MKEITVAELKQLKDDKADFQLIDVREDHEIEICEIGGKHIPMAEVIDNLDLISKDKKIIVMCRSGARSANICNVLIDEGYEDVFNLKGGILAWSREIDSSIEQY
jgi:adenylyltransferase/sulfurtransferase